MLGNLIFGRLQHFICNKPEFLHQSRARRRAAETMHADDRSLRTGIPIPADDGAGLDSHSRLDTGRQDFLAISSVLLLEQFPTWHADHAGGNSLALELFVGGDAPRDLAAAGDEDHLRRAARSIGRWIRHDISTAHKALSGCVARAVESGQFLSAEHETGRSIDQVYNHLVASRTSLASAGRSTIMLGMA